MKPFHKALPLKRRGQIAVIITFIIAVVFLFITVFINLAKVSQTKAATSVAADKAALSLASQLGSISHYYKDKVLKIAGPCAAPPCQKCDTDWMSLAAIIGVAVVIGAAAFFVPAAIIAGPLALAMSASILSGVNAKYSGMTGYNAFRESTLFQALASIQGDDVELKVKTPGMGIFYDDLNNNGAFDATNTTSEPVYNLSSITEMRNQKKVSRFAAWYYALRLPLVDDELMRRGLEEFLSNPIGGVRRFTDVDEWDTNKLQINKLSYLIAPGSGDRDYDVTCSQASCPDWVKNSGQELLRIVKIDAANNVSGGFLRDKFVSLLNRLEASYGLTFCDSNGCTNANALIEDIRMFLLRSKEVLNTPVSERINMLTQWFPLWYDPTKHNYDRTSKDGKYDYDIYLRLSRDQKYIDDWIGELEKLNNEKIKPGITDHHESYCEEGRPDSGVVYNCFTTITSCYCWHTECGEYSCWKVCDGNKCETSLPARWYGNYGTCTGSGFDHTTHPVCQGGDLYGASPNYLGANWCNNLKSVSCASNDDDCNECSPPPTNTVTDNSYHFQGQMSWENTSGPTEVEQAIRILRALKNDLIKIQLSIAALADKIAVHLPSSGEPYTDANNNGAYDLGEAYVDIDGDKKYTPLLAESAKRNEITYSWKDKPNSDNSQQFFHFARVMIKDYPVNLPNITESVEWGWTGPIPVPRKCRTLNDYQGSVQITTWRYDQDRPTDIGKTEEGKGEVKGWELKQRKSPQSSEFDPDQLKDIAEDIQDNGKIDSTQDKVGKILPESIKSCSKAHYGPGKSDIYISQTTCD